MIRLSRKMTLIKLASEQDVKPVTPKKTSSNVTKSAASKKTNIKKKATTKTKVGKAIAKAKK